MVFNSLDKYQGRVTPEAFARLAEHAPDHWGVTRKIHCHAFFVENWSQTRIAKAANCSQSTIRGELISLLAFWALAHGAVGTLRDKPKTGGSMHGLQSTDCNP